MPDSKPTPPPMDLDSQVLYTFEYFTIKPVRVKRVIIDQPGGYFDVMAGTLMPYSKNEPGAHGKICWLDFVPNALVNYSCVHITKTGHGNIARKVHPDLLDDPDDENPYNDKLAIQWFEPREFNLITRNYKRQASGQWYDEYCKTVWPVHTILEWMTWALMNLPDCNIRGFQ